MNVYFDNASTTKVSEAAALAAQRAMSEDFGNPSSGHAPGRLAAERLENDRACIAAALGAGKDELFFTSGGTEANNWAIFSGAKLMRHKGRHIISSKTEHDSVLKPLSALSQQGYEITLLDPDNAGAICDEDLIGALREDTVLISLMLVNNETGAISEIEEMFRAVRNRRCNALLHTDAVQGFMKIPFTAKKLGADLITVSAHKLHGMKGSGALYVRSSVKLPPLIIGGGQENGLRSGTEAAPQIAAFAAAVQAAGEAREEASKSIRGVRELIISELMEKLPATRIICPDGAPHILSLSLPGYKAETLMNYLDAKGICVAKGSACKRGGRSHVIEALKLPADVADGTLRLSFCSENTAEEARYFTEQLINAARELFTSSGRHGK